MDDEFPLESIVNQLQSLQEQFNNVSSDNIEKNSVTDSLISRKEKGEITQQELNKLLVKSLKEKHKDQQERESKATKENDSLSEKIGNSVSSGISKIFKSVFKKSEIPLSSENTDKNDSNDIPPGGVKFAHLNLPQPGTYGEDKKPDIGSKISSESTKASSNSKSTSENNFKRAREVESVTKFINVSVVDIDDNAVRKLIHIFGAAQSHNNNDRQYDLRRSNDSEYRTTGHGFLSKLFDLGKLGLMGYVGTQFLKKFLTDSKHTGLGKLVGKLFLTPVEYAIRGAIRKFSVFVSELGDMFMRGLKDFKIDKLFASVKTIFKDVWAKAVTKFPKIAKVASTLLKPLGSVLKILGPIGKILSKSLGLVFKKIPIIGTILSLGVAYMRFKRGETWRGVIDVLSGIAALVPGPGTAIAIGLDVINMFLDHKVASDKEAGVKTFNLTDWFKGAWTKTKEWLSKKVMENKFFRNFYNIAKSVTEFISGKFGSGLSGILNGVFHLTGIPQIHQGWQQIMHMINNGNESKISESIPATEERVDINKAFRQYISDKLNKVPSIKYLKDLSTAFKKIKNGDARGGFKDFIKATKEFGIRGITDVIPGFNLIDSFFSDTNTPPTMGNIFGKTSNTKLPAKENVRHHTYGIDNTRNKFANQLNSTQPLVTIANNLDNISKHNTLKPVTDSINAIGRDQSDLLKKQVFLQEDNNNLLRQLISILPGNQSKSNQRQHIMQPGSRGNGIDNTSRDVFQSSPYSYAAS